MTEIGKFLEREGSCKNRRVGELVESGGRSQLDNVGQYEWTGAFSQNGLRVPLGYTLKTLSGAPV